MRKSTNSLTSNFIVQTLSCKYLEIYVCTLNNVITVQCLPLANKCKIGALRRPQRRCGQPHYNRRRYHGSPNGVTISSHPSDVATETQGYGPFVADDVDE